MRRAELEIWPEISFLEEIKGWEICGGGEEDPFSQAKGRKGGRKEMRTSVERGIWVCVGGNRKETEARDRRSNAEAW